MNKNIILLPGDGIGPEVTREALKVIETIGAKYSHTFTFEEYLLGGSALEQHGTPLPKETWNACTKAKVIFVGAVGDPKWDKNPV